MEVDSRVLGLMGIFQGANPEIWGVCVWHLAGWEQDMHVQVPWTPQTASRTRKHRSVKRWRMVAFWSKRALGEDLAQSPILPTETRSLQSGPSRR